MSDNDTQAPADVAEQTPPATPENEAADVSGGEAATGIVAGEGGERDLNAEGAAAFARIGVVPDEDGTMPGDRVVDGLTAAIDELEQLRASNATLIAELETVKDERDKAVEELAKAANAPKSRAAKAPKPRDCGPLKENFAADDLLELIKGAKRVEVAFSDGKKEISSLPAQVIEGDAWRIGVTGLQLTIPLEAKGAVSLAGYGLFLDNKLIAYRARPDVLEISQDHVMQLAGDVVF